MFDMEFEKGRDEAGIEQGRDRPVRSRISQVLQVMSQRLSAVGSDEIADLILELATGAQDMGGPAMTPEQIEESLRRAADFRPADPDRVKQLLARLA